MVARVTVRLRRRCRACLLRRRGAVRHCRDVMRTATRRGELGSPAPRTSHAARAAVVACRARSPRSPVAAVPLTRSPLGGVSPAPAAPAPRIVAIGDIHGAGPGLAQILQAAGLIDAKQQVERRHRPAGADRRHPRPRRRRARGDRSADAARGRGAARRRARRRAVRQSRGHERPSRFPRRLRRARSSRFADARSDERRRKAFDTHAGIAKRAGVDARSRRLDARRIRAGTIEYVEAFGPSGTYGRWIRARKPILQIGDTIFMHAGLHPERTITIEEVNRTVEQEVRGWDELVAALERARLAAPFFTLQEIINAAQVEIGKIGDRPEDRRAARGVRHAGVHPAAAVPDEFREAGADRGRRPAVVSRPRHAARRSAAGGRRAAATATAPAAS